MIIHLDADAFYVSVEQVERPELKGKMVAVGGQTRGIIASASYEARRMGVYTPMPTAKARKLCPSLIVISGSMEKYSRVSRAMFAIIEDFTPYIERTSIDEGYFDVSGHRTLSPLEIARQMKARIRAELGITVSLGIGSSKLISQIASKLRKPDALVEVPRGTERAFLAPLQAHWLPGVGAKLAAQLKQYSLHTIDDVARADPALVELAAGSFAPRLQAFARGEDDRPIELDHGDAKSYGTQDTFFENISDRDEILRILRTMADKLMASVRDDGKAIRTATVKVRYADFTDHSHGVTLPGPTDLETDLFPLLDSLLRGAWKRREPLRLVSLRVSNVTDAVVQQELALDPAAKRRARQHEAAKLIDQLRAKSLPISRGHGIPGNQT